MSHVIKLSHSAHNQRIWGYCKWLYPMMVPNIQFKKISWVIVISSFLFYLTYFMLLSGLQLILNYYWSFTAFTLGIIHLVYTQMVLNNISTLWYAQKLRYILNIPTNTLGTKTYILIHLMLFQYMWVKLFFAKWIMKITFLITVSCNNKH